MMKSNILTPYVNEIVQKHRSELPKFIIDQLQVVIDANREVERLTQRKLHLKIKHQKLTDQKKRLMKRIYQDLKFFLAIVQIRGEEIKKHYFPVPPSSIFYSGEKISHLLKNINARIAMDSNSPLIAYQDQLIADQQVLNDILVACYDTRGGGQVATSEKQTAIKKWHLEYVRLKGLLRYVLLESSLDYRIFFKDLTLTASKQEREG